MIDKTEKVIQQECLDELIWGKLVNGQIGIGEFGRIHSHALKCRECRQKVAEIMAQVLRKKDVLVYPYNFVIAAPLSSRCLALEEISHFFGSINDEIAFKKAYLHYHARFCQRCATLHEMAFEYPEVSLASIDGKTVCKMIEISLYTLNDDDIAELIGEEGLDELMVCNNIPEDRSLVDYMMSRYPQSDFALSLIFSLNDDGKFEIIGFSISQKR
jgi:hypothetical protein